MTKSRLIAGIMIALVAFAAMFMQGCSSSSDSKADDSSFTVEYTDPTAGETAPVDVVVYVVFNQLVDEASVTENSFYITDSNGTRIPGTRKIVNQEKGVSFTSDSLYVSGETYTINVTTAVKNSDGHTLNEPFQLQFKCQE
ncbi:MAG: Ig-like domain-containing protein [Firmicutes bacterium]|nr:Ig-like domain-containing protein [Bacillota bacterium]